MALLSAILNLPWTVVGLASGLISLPRSVRIRHRPFAVVLHVQSIWWMPRGTRAAAIGNAVLLGPHLEPKDLEHELVHVAQYNRWPFIFASMYLLETLQHSNRDNKYELEAYKIAGNVYKTN